MSGTKNGIRILVGQAVLELLSKIKISALIIPFFTPSQFLIDAHARTIIMQFTVEKMEERKVEGAERGCLRFFAIFKLNSRYLLYIFCQHFIQENEGPGPSSFIWV